MRKGGADSRPLIFVCLIWGTRIAVVAIAGVWLFSIFATVSYASELRESSDGRYITFCGYGFGLRNGIVAVSPMRPVSVLEMDAKFEMASQSGDPVAVRREALKKATSPGLYVGRHRPWERWSGSLLSVMGLRLPHVMRSAYGSDYSIPVWLILCVPGVPLAIRFMVLRYRRRRLPGHCARCNYNLKGNVSGVCSECGEPVKVQ